MGMLIALLRGVWGGFVVLVILVIERPLLRHPVEGPGLDPLAQGSHGRVRKRVVRVPRGKASGRRGRRRRQRGPVSDPRVEPPSGAKERQQVAARTHVMASRDEGGQRGFESTGLGVESTAVSA